jgi:hypothetical protein
MEPFSVMGAYRKTFAAPASTAMFRDRLVLHRPRPVLEQSTMRRADNYAR